MKNILFLNPVPLISKGIMWGFQQNNWNCYLMEGEDFVLGKDSETQINAINKYVEQYKIDMVFLDFGVGPAYKEIHDYCISKGIPLFCWCIEDIPSYPDFTISIMPYIDYIFTTCEELIPLYKEKYNRDSSLLLFGVNSDFHKPQLPNKELYPYDITLVSNNYSSRYDKMKWFLQPLLDKNYNIGIYGNDWWMSPDREFNLSKYPHVYKGYLGYDELPVIYNTVNCVLGVNCNDESISQCSMRPFEHLGCSNNSLLVSFYTKAQEIIFGDRIYLPKNLDETIQMVNEVLSMSDEQRIQKAKNNREWVIKNHNYKDRAKIVIDVYEKYFV